MRSYIIMYLRASVLSEHQQLNEYMFGLHMFYQIKYLRLFNLDNNNKKKKKNIYGFHSSDAGIFFNFNKLQHSTMKLSTF